MSTQKTDMPAREGVSRRGFIKLVALTGGGFSLGFLVEGCSHLKGAQRLGGAFHPNAWLRITPDNVVTFLMDRAEMGQGIYTGHVQLLAEELEVDPTKVKVEFAPADRDAYGFQITGGSTSTTSQWEIIREAGATARELLRLAAARRWHVTPGQVTAVNGTMTHPLKGTLTYGELASEAPQGKMSDVKLKDPDKWKVAGTSMRRLDGPAKVDGSAKYGLDVKLPGMLYAVVIRPPVLRDSVKGFDAKVAQGMPGVKAVLQIPHGLAVVADSTWRARKAADKVEADWTAGEMRSFSTEKLQKQHLDRLQKLGKSVHSNGDVPEAMASAHKKVSGIYQVPFLAHAPMEPMNCTAHVKPDRCDVWAGTQAPTIAQEVASRITGLPHSDVFIHGAFLGGGFGRRAGADYVAEAVEVSKRIKAPVQVVWSREDDMRHAQYRPAATSWVQGGVDKDGMPVAWQYRLVTQGLVPGFIDMLGTFAPEWVPRPVMDLVESGIGKFMMDGHVADPTVTEGSEPAYTLPNVKVELAQVENGVPVFFWRSVGHSINGFIVESFIDELAHLGGKDPFELRRQLLTKAPRNKAALELCAEKIGWGSKPPEGRFRGIAQHASFGSYCAHAVEISLDGGLKIHRVVTAIDCGRAVNPDLVAAQMEGGVMFGLSAAIQQRIDFDGGRVRQGNFHQYPLLRMRDAPDIETHIVPSKEKPSGVGELAVPPIAPALTNAIFAATGVRLRRLPIEEDLRLVLQGKPIAEVAL